MRTYATAAIATSATSLCCEGRRDSAYQAARSLSAEPTASAVTGSSIPQRRKSWHGGGARPLAGALSGLLMGAPTHHLARAPLRALPTLGPAGTLLTLLALRAGSACESLQTTSNRHGPGYSPRQGLCTYMYTTTASCIYIRCV